MERKYELLYMNKAKHGETVPEDQDAFYDTSLREKVIDSEIPNNKSNEEILKDIVSRHSQDWVDDLPTVQKVKIRSMLSDLEHPKELETGDCVKIGDEIWFLTSSGFKIAPPK